MHIVIVCVCVCVMYVCVSKKLTFIGDVEITQIQHQRVLKSKIITAFGY